jgi:hypothetical protein
MKMKDKLVTVDVTPNGYGDAVTDGYFVKPEERLMNMQQFVDALLHPSDSIYYLQHQVPLPPLIYPPLTHTLTYPHD